MIQKIIAHEYPHPDENKITKDIIKILKKSLLKDYDHGRPMKRRLHAKSHGLAEAELIVEPNLPPDLKAGLFKTEAIYKVWIRFSNGASTISSDYKKGVRGMAIKILDADTSFQKQDKTMGSQDILLTNNKIIFPGTVQWQKRAMQVLFVSKLYFICILLSFKLRGLFTFLKGQIKIANVLEQDYYSGTPYLFGSGQAVKWQANPLKPSTSAIPINAGENFLREQLARDLANNDYFFDLNIQFQKDADEAPIEDSAIEWTTPFIKVATIKILQQDVDTAERRKQAEEMIFSAWHCVADHRPLGGINRIRKEIYKELAAFRKHHQAEAARN